MELSSQHGEVDALLGASGQVARDGAELHSLQNRGDHPAIDQLVLLGAGAGIELDSELPPPPTAVTIQSWLVVTTTGLPDALLVAIVHHQVCGLAFWWGVAAV